MTQEEHHGWGYVLLVSMVAALGGLLFGYDTAVISGSIGYVVAHFELSPHQEGWAAGSALIGCIIGALVAGTLSDAIGRRRVLIVSAVLFGISAVFSAVPQSLGQLAAARIIGGIGVGAASLLSPLYIAEIAPARIRGRLVSVNQFAIVFGMLVVYFVNAYIARLGETIGGEAWNIAYGWRWMFGSETLPAVIFLVLLFFVPESPRWLIKRGQTDKARAILNSVGGARHADTAVADIEATLRQERGSILELFEPGFRIALVIGIVLAVLQQITGINVVLYYAPRIFQSAGLGAVDAIGETVFVGIINILFTVVAILVVDRLGRKPLLLLASAGMGISLFLLGGVFELGRFEGRLVLIFVLTYVASFAVAMGPVVWVVMSEIFPTRVRGAAMSIATVLLWATNYVVSQSFPWMLDTFAGRSFFFFGIMCVIAFVFVAAVLPETKGKSLEDIERYWMGEGRT